ncbi:hypothetical protein XMM354_003321 [Aliiroseovarius sp. xm-m-354]|nr:hypothetical protein [Aliiroseovarius sp. xm-m-354]
MHAPRFLQHFRGIARLVLRDVAARGHHGGGHQIGRQAVGFDRGFARLNAVALGDDFPGFRQRQHRVAAFVHITRQVAIFVLGLQGAARTSPVMLFGLQLQQRIAGFFVFGLQRECLLGQLQRCIGIPVSQLLLHDATHADETSLFVFDQLAVGPFGLAAVACEFSGLGRQQIG